MARRPDGLATGWDLGGAHVKAAQSDRVGRLRVALQVPCTLWRGLDHLGEAIGQARRQLVPTRRHAITMTGELADLFADRADGVARICAAMRESFPDADLQVYAGEACFVALSFGAALLLKRPTGWQQAWFIVTATSAVIAVIVYHAAFCPKNRSYMAALPFCALRLP